MTAKISKEKIQEAIACCISMSQAAEKLNIPFSTFKRKAILYKLYIPNPGLKGSRKPKIEGRGKIPLKEILAGHHPQYQSYKLKHRLFQEGLKKNQCEKCLIETWNDNKIECELDHIDGNKNNNRLNNLRILCPNCHSQTDTFRFKRGKGA
jgi:hypothetical protein